MTTTITMPALSPTMEEGNLAKWHVKVGDKIKPGDIIAEIETDKATMEVEAVDEGTVTKLLVEEGAQGVKVNAVIAELDGEARGAKCAAVREHLSVCADCRQARAAAPAAPRRWRPRAAGRSPRPGCSRSRPPLRAAGLVDHVNGVALADEILRPAFAAVGRAGEIGAGHRAAVHHDDRIGMRLFGRDANLDVHLAVDVVAAVDRHGLAADIHEAVARENERLVGRLHAAACEQHDGGERCHREFFHDGSP